MIKEKTEVPNRGGFELVSWRGEVFGPYPTMYLAVKAAHEKWPGQEQDEECLGRGWDIQIVGAK